ncbi:GID complex subunit containing RING finger motif [Taxawa tesnikishii (nom. ined.)]|nr:GID complex subunit containing RING finger motif [Dothideales sp. JES 119]
MAEHTTTTLNAQQHLLLDQPLLRLPHELTRKNFKNAQRLFERTRDDTLASLDSAAKASVSSPPDTTLASLDAMIAKAQTLKRKLESLHNEELQLHRSQRARLQHLRDLHEIPSLADVKYDEWSKREAVGEREGVEELVDVSAFEVCGAVEMSLRRDKRTQDALQWCGENKQALKKINVGVGCVMFSYALDGKDWDGRWDRWIDADVTRQSNLELELRLQQFIELARSDDTAKRGEATLHARKLLGAQQDPDYGLRAGGLLAHPANTMTEPYKSMYAPSRWDFLADLFVKTHHEIFSLPPKPLLHIALSAGLSALKTPSCHSAFASSSANAASSTTSKRAVCTPLQELCGTGYRGIAKWKDIWARTFVFHEREDRDEGWQDPGSDEFREEYDQSEIKKVFIL